MASIYMSVHFRSVRADEHVHPPSAMEEAGRLCLSSRPLTSIELDWVILRVASFPPFILSLHLCLLLSLLSGSLGFTLFGPRIK